MRALAAGLVYRGPQRWGLAAGSAALVSLAGALIVVRSASLAVAITIGAVTMAAARRWPVSIWAAVGAVSLFLDDYVRTTVAFSHGGKVIYISDLVPVLLVVAYVSVDDRRERIGRRMSLWLGALFFLVVLLTFFRTITDRGLTPALQVRYLLPFLLCATLPLSRRFREISASQTATVISWLAIAIAVKSFSRIGSGYETTTSLDVERIYQTWEPFIAAAMALTLLGYVLLASDVRRLHYVGLALAPVPVLFSFFRTAWVLSLGIGVVVFLLARRGTRRGALIAGAVVVVATFLLGSYAIQPESGKSLASQVVLRSSQVHLQLDSYRTQEYSAVWREIVKHPWVGSGYGTQYQGDWTIYTTTAHNAYEWIWWRMGLVGLGIFLCFLFCVARETVRALPGLDTNDRALAVGLLAGLAFVLLAANLHENFENYQSNLFDCLLIAQLIGLSIKGSRPSARI